MQFENLNLSSENRQPLLIQILDDLYIDTDILTSNNKDYKTVKNLQIESKDDFKQWIKSYLKLIHR